MHFQTRTDWEPGTYSADDLFRHTIIRAALAERDGCPHTARALRNFARQIEGTRARGCVMERNADGPACETQVPDYSECATSGIILT